MKRRGILLVANKRSQSLCYNLVRSIRITGCELPITIIHFGGDAIDSEYLLKECKCLNHSMLPASGLGLVEKLSEVLKDCPKGFLYRFIGWYLDWDQFIYSDNDIVAISNWTDLFDKLEENDDLLHADLEYTTKGIYNYKVPQKVKEIFSESVFDKEVTAGHFLVNIKQKHIDHLINTINWFKKNPDIPKFHDQALLNICIHLHDWKTINLCQGPYMYLSSWHGDYKNSFDFASKVAMAQGRITHIHYSGYTPVGLFPMEELLKIDATVNERIKSHTIVGLKFFSGFYYISSLIKKVKRKLKNI